MKELKAMAASYGRSALAGALARLHDRRNRSQEIGLRFSRWRRSATNALPES
jgi:hypothetical protein